VDLINFFKISFHNIYRYYHNTFTENHSLNLNGLKFSLITINRYTRTPPRKYAAVIIDRYVVNNCRDRRRLMCCLSQSFKIDVCFCHLILSHYCLLDFYVLMVLKVRHLLFCPAPFTPQKKKKNRNVSRIRPDDRQTENGFEKRVKISFFFFRMIIIKR